LPNKIEKIISGGQTGADRAAFDFAIECGISLGGFVPQGRIAEDGRIPDKYTNLIETETDDPTERTEKNVHSSDATLIFSQGPLSGGSKLTLDFAQKFEKPVLHIDLLDLSFADAIARVRSWLDGIDGRVLNIAGPRASEDERIYESVYRFLSAL
jgi:hypothetical protein